ncbi:MAG: 5-bromo-4-chloroindolyl phosphate hydrolysis family protein [Eubacteriales bacterium]
MDKNSYSNRKNTEKSDQNQEMITPEQDGGMLSWMVVAGLFMIATPLGLTALFAKLCMGEELDRAVKKGSDFVSDQFSGKTKDFVDKKKNTTQKSNQSVGNYVEKKVSTYTKNFHKNRAKKKLKEYGDCHFGTGSVLAIVGASLAFGAGLSPLWMLVSLPFFGLGMSQKSKAKRMIKYYNVIGEKEQISVLALAEMAGENPSRVSKDLETMLQIGCFECGYLNHKHGLLLLTDADIELDNPYQRVEKPSTPDEDNVDENAILQEIRMVSRDIDNKKLSAQVDHIGMITAKIFDYQKTRGDKSAQLHSFLSYYLPTTLKILRAYTDLENQEIDGENITTAMARIEEMMDKVVEGFEKRLDQLFQTDTMDVTSDISVLELMLSKDGLIKDNTFQDLGDKTRKDLGDSDFVLKL